LANGQYPCIIARLGIHWLTFYDVLWSILKVLNTSHELVLLGLLSTHEELEKAARGFAAISNEGK